MKTKLFLLLILLSYPFSFLSAQYESPDIKKAGDLIERNNLTEAWKYIQKELANDPDSPYGLTYSGIISYTYGDYGSALSLFDAALKQLRNKDKETRSALYLMRGTTYLNIGDSIEALNDFRQGARLAPEDIQNQHNLADLYFQMQQYDNSEKVYRKILKRFPNDPYSYYGLAKNAYIRCDFGAAKEYIRKGVERDTNEETINLMLMRSELLDQNDEKGVEYGIRTVAANLSNQEAFDFVTVMADSLYESTVDAILRIRYQIQNADNLHLLLSHIYIRHGEYNQALLELHPFLENTDPKNIDALYQTAFCYGQLQNDSMAIKYAERMIEVDSTLVNAYTERATARFYLTDWAGAEKDFRKAMELDKEESDVYYMQLGCLYEIQHKYEQALKYYDTSCSLNPDNAYIYIQRGFLLKEYRNDPEKAAQDFEQCLNLNPYDYTSLAFAYAGLGETEKAKAITDSILIYYPGNQSYYLAACIYCRIEDTGNALQYLKKALENGYKRIQYMENDPHLELVRKTSGYQELILQYTGKEVPSDTKGPVPQQTGHIVTTPQKKLLQQTV